MILVSKLLPSLALSGIFPWFAFADVNSEKTHGADSSPSSPVAYWNEEYRPPRSMLNMDENRIIGGTTSAAGAWPFFVKMPDGCGGSLVAEDVVLTAGHCYDEFVNSVVVGASTHFVDAASQVRSIESEMRPHPDYGGVRKDFMLFKITRVTKPNLKPIRFNNNPKIPANDEWLTTIGLGRLSQTGPSATELLEVKVQKETTAECNAKTNSSDPIEPETEFCADTEMGGKDSCPVSDSFQKTISFVG